MSIKEIILDSLDKIQKFSSNEEPYRREPSLLLPQTTINSESPSFYETFTRKDGGYSGQVRIMDLYDVIVNNNISYSEFDIDSRVEISNEPRLIETIRKNASEFGGDPCFSVEVERWGKTKQTFYPKIVIQVLIGSSGLINRIRRSYIKDNDRTFGTEIEYIEIEERLVDGSELPDNNPLCVKKSIFYASDQNWGVVPLNTNSVKEITLENRGETRLVVNSFSPNGDKNFTIQDLNTPIEILPNNSFSFNVQYNPLDESETTHTLIIRYEVFEDGNSTKPVVGEKLVSYLAGTGDKRDIIDDVIDDLDDSVLTDDDNGTYVTKTLSRIVDKSSPIERWNTEGLWKCAGEKLDQYFTASNGTINDSHYIPVYNKVKDTPNSFHQFDISFGHRTGLGSKLVVDGMDIKPSRTMYRKYLVECYEPEANTSKLRPTKFKFKNGVNGDYAYFIQMDRERFKDMLDPGNFELCLSPLSSSSNQLINTGSNVQVDQTSTTIFTLIDESWDAKQEQTDRRNLKDWYYVVSGSKRDGVYSEESDNAWGVVFPRLGLIVLDGVVLDQSCSFNTVTASIDGQNSQKLFLSISGSSSTTTGRSFSGSFFARSAEKTLTETYFCRIRQNEFNYSNNPTYVSGSDNKLKYDYFITNPKSYITSIGLYNKKGTLLAVGKLKRPILKDDNKSYTFQVRVRLN
jgi:hypothetical protein